MYQFDVAKCAHKLKPYIFKTPIIESETLSEAVGTRVFLKLESFQKTGAFKFRGAMNYLLSLSKKEKEKGVITASSGNHGLGMSLGSQILGVDCTVVMPTRAPLIKQERAKRYGAKVLLYGDTYDDAAKYAESLGKQKDLSYVPSFNNYAIMEGQGTILAEILEELQDVQLVIAPIGGGGLISGLLIACDQFKTDLKVYGAEPVGAASMKASVDAGKLVALKEMKTIADGVAVESVGDLTFDVVNTKRPRIIEVSDADILKTQKMLLTEAKVLAESAAAVSVAALLRLSENAEKLPEKLVCVISGGNTDTESLQALLS